MKKLVYLMFVLPLIMLASCTSDEDGKEIRGTWRAAPGLQIELLPVNHPKKTEIERALKEEYDYKSISFNNDGTVGIAVKDNFDTRAIGKKDDGDYDVKGDHIYVKLTDSSIFFTYYILDNTITLNIPDAGDDFRKEYKDITSIKVKWIGKK